MKKLFGKIGSFFKFIFSDTKRTIVFLVSVVVVGLIVGGTISGAIDDRKRQQALDEASTSTDSIGEDGDGSNDSYIISAQDELKKTFGDIPEGYLWDVDGTLLSLGDKDMSAEDVVYAYLNGLRTLDISAAQKYSRNSLVVDTYSSYFDSKDVSSDYYDSFVRNMYKEVLLSIQPLEIVDTTLFADNKQVFTVKLEVLDLTSKDFWLQDKDTIYKNLYIYSNDENDSAKSEIYLYDYVLSYYRSPEAVTRTVDVNLTVEKYPDLDTGWLVSIDKDINDICNYTDGTLMVNYINRMYSQEGIEYIQNSSSTEEIKEGDE